MSAQPSAIPPKIQTRPSLAFFGAAMLVFVALAGAAVLYFFDPAKSGFYPICQFHLLTGLYCPGCGGTRATYQLLHGNFPAALHDNALYVISLAVVAMRGGWYLKRKFYRQPVGLFIPPMAVWMFLVVAVVFVILRNLPEFSFLAPL